MDNLLSYVNFRGDLSFKASPFNIIDAAVLSVLSGLDLCGLSKEKVTLAELLELYKERNRRDELDTRVKDKEMLFFRMAASRRYSSIILTDYTREINKEEETTFYAMTCELPKHELFVAFRGTDGSLVSWKENFNAMFTLPTYGQLKAKEYIDEKLRLFRFRKCIVAGHSKGGNLAAYAATFADAKLQKRIKSVCCFDSPGFFEDIRTLEEYKRIEDRFNCIIPVGSVIGRLMHTYGQPVVVKSAGKGVYQHDMFHWSVNAYGFDTEESVDLFSDSLSGKVNAWIEGIEVSKREAVVDELFNVFMKNGINHISDLMHVDLKTLLGLLLSVKSLSKENRELLMIILKELRNH